eukprot:UN21635
MYIKKFMFRFIRSLDEEPSCIYLYQDEPTEIVSRHLKYHFPNMNGVFGVQEIEASDR